MRSLIVNGVSKQHSYSEVSSMGLVWIQANPQYYSGYSFNIDWNNGSESYNSFLNEDSGSSYAIFSMWKLIVNGWDIYSNFTYGCNIIWK